MFATMLRLSIGVISLITGRQLYWLYSGGVAFITAFFLSPLFYNLGAGLDLFFTALGIGVVAAFLTFLVGRVMVALLSFFAGGYLLVMMPNTLGWGTEWFSWIFFVIAGIVATLLVLVWFDFTLILLSSLTGANLIVQTVQLSVFNINIAFFALAIFGMVTQAILLQYWPTEEGEET
jgi:hypothetical protein